MRMATSTLAKGPVVCGLCETEFAMPRQAEQVAETTIAAAPAEPGFTRRRQQQLAVEGIQPDRMQEGLDFLSAFEQAMRVVAARTGDDRPLEVFQQQREGIAEWYEGVVTADVVDLDKRRLPEVDLRTIRLPSLDLPAPEPPTAAIEIAGPEL